MKLRKLSWFMLATLVGFTTFIACQDEFDEMAFLQEQARLAQEAADAEQARKDAEAAAKKAANEEQTRLGDLLKSLTFQLVQPDGTVVPGLNVTISTLDADGNPTTATIATDANGNAVFGDVPIGGVAFEIDDPNGVFLSAKGILDTENGATRTTTDSDGNVIAKRRSEAVTLDVFSSAASELGTISGRLEVETNVTNETPEIPQDVVIVADLSTAASSAKSDGVDVRLYEINQDNISSGYTYDNATGAFSLSVPATQDGVTVNLLYPELQLDQTIAIDERNGVKIDPEYATVPTSFGPDIDSDDINSVTGVKAVFPAPPAAGQGFGFTFTIKPRDLGGFTQTNLSGDFTASNIRYQVTNRGAGYTISPDVAVTDGGGTGAKMEAAIEVSVAKVAITDGDGTIDPATLEENDQVRVRFVSIDGDGNERIKTFNEVLTVNASGDIDTDDIDLSASSFEKFDTEEFDNPGTFNGYDIASHTIKFHNQTKGEDVTSQFAGSITFGTDGHVSAVRMNDAGNEDYTSAPTITFTGGNGTTQAVMNVLAFATLHKVEVDNSNNTTEYMVEPASIVIEHTSASGGETTSNEFRDKDAANAVTFLGSLTVENGNIVWEDPTREHFTEFFSTTTPEVIIEDKDVEIASADVELDDGEVTGLEDVENGVGYNAEFTVSIVPSVTGAPGTGATVQLTGGTLSATSGEFTWDGDFTITSKGSGYVSNLNQITSSDFSGTASVSIKSGEVRNIGLVSYGTGQRNQNVD